MVCVPSRGHVLTVATALLVLDSGNADANKLAMVAESTVLNINGSLLGEGCRASAVDEMDVAAEKKKWSAVFPGVDELADIESKPIRCGKDAHDFKEFEDHEVGRTDNVLVRCLAHSCTAWVVRVARLWLTCLYPFLVWQDGFDTFTPIRVPGQQGVMASVPHLPPGLATSVASGRRSSSHSDVGSLVRHAVSVEVYRAMMSCRRVTLSVVSRRLKDGDFDVGKITDLVAILKLFLATASKDSTSSWLDGAGSSQAATSAGDPLPIAWEVVRRLCEGGAPDVIATLIDEAVLNMWSAMRHAVTLESKHPISDKDGYKCVVGVVVCGSGAAVC